MVCPLCTSTAPNPPHAASHVLLPQPLNGGPVTIPNEYITMEEITLREEVELAQNLAGRARIGAQACLSPWLGP